MIQLLRTYLRPYRGVLVVISLLLLVQAFTNLYLPNLNADIINNGVVTGDVAYIVRLGGIMLLVSAILGVASIVTVYYSARTAMRVGRDMRRDLFTRVESLSLGQVNALGVPSLITRNTNDVQQLQMLVMVGLTMMVLAPVTAVGAIIMAIRENAQLALLLIVVIPLMLAVISIMVFKAIPMFRAMQTKIDRVNLVLRENLTGIRVIRAFNQTDREEARFEGSNADLTDTALRVTRLFALILPALMLIMNLSSVAVIWFGGHLVADGSMPIGNLTAFLAYIMQILMSVMMAVMTLMMVPRASASADRINEVLATHADIVDQVDDPAGITTPGLVEFRNVDFRYPGAQEAILQDITVTFEPGTTNAILGGTGSGKTTLVNLIPRLLDTTEGDVLVGGHNVRLQPQEHLWKRFGIVPQKAFLFSGTIASNMRFGRPDATEAQIWHALEVAQAADFVRELPELLEAPVDQGGANFSGGQRQRLAIARAIVREPEVYIFDDSFSALDYATDARLRRALSDEISAATIIIVAQRVSSVVNADHIVVMDYGRVVGQGTHEELLDSCETYREIVASQLEVAVS
ncbi:MAG: ABC transporter ATP-binding protein [Actinobacteria bacterium]|nr:ABC transporter ATP-binding protein [Actinomycetota bacterium]